MSSTQVDAIGAEVNSTDDVEVEDLSSASTDTSSLPSTEASSPIHLETLIQDIFTQKGLQLPSLEPKPSVPITSKTNRSNLFYLDVDSRDAAMLVEQTRDFLSKYDMRSPQAIEQGYVHGDALGRLLRATVPKTQFASLLNVFNGCIVQWIHALFKFPQSVAGLLPQSAAAGRLAAARAALARKFLGYETKGFFAFGNTTPTLYATTRTPSLEELCAQLGLPQEALRAGDDIVAMIESDIGQNRTPFFICASAGDEYGNCDDLLRIRAVARNEYIWMHVEGESICLLAMTEPPKSCTSIFEADSIQYNACNLIGIDKFNAPMLFYRIEPANILADDPSRATSSTVVDVIDSTGSKSVDLQMGLWMALHLTGRDKIVNAITSAQQLVSRMHSGLNANPHIRLLHHYKSTHLQITFRFEPALESGAQQDAVPLTEPQMSLSGSVIIYPTPRSPRRNSKSAVTVNLEESPSKNPSKQSPPPEITADEPSTDELSHPPSSLSDEGANDSAYQILGEILPHLNAVNQQILSDILSSLGTDLVIDVVPVEGETFLRFRPFAHPHVPSIGEDTVATFCDNLFIESNLISSFVASRPAFRKAVSAKEGLLLVNSVPPNLLGLGTVRYRPAFLAALAGTAKEGDKLAVLVDDLNKQIVAALNEANPMYTSAKTDDGHECIAISIGAEMMTPTAAEEQAGLIYETAVKVELEMKIFDRVGQLVRQFVKETEAKMKQESEELRNQTGIIRKLPIVGSMWNWWSPVADPRKGKKFDLVTTSLEEPNIVTRLSLDDEHVHSADSEYDSETDEEYEEEGPQ